MPRRPTVLAVALLCGVQAACAPDCDALCGKLERCGLDGDVPRLECRTTCERQITQVDDDTDDATADALRAHRVCLGSHSCDEIAAGVCYDPLLFPYSETPQPEPL
jgi:hypothetical protein